MKKSTLAGAVLATAVALMFSGTTVMADDSSKPASPQVKCVGGNSCKGQSACKAASNDCKGQNGCKGKGFTMEQDEKGCTDKGGTPSK
ncbi:MAG TPA: putative cross-wall-targeting lipoprotein signal domain-containing protein [Candidatus Binataceae bacterium]|nr:putative cross-wall-targeting lipoprotein signal domain-containing protein [Candidatus Binataceae bacterium]